jgi:hypothetical protein
MSDFIFPFVAALLFFGLLSLLLLCVFKLCHKNLFKHWRPSLNARRIIAASFIGLPVVGACWVAWEAVYPSEDFFVAEYGLVMLDNPLPTSAKFIRKVASYPDFHGDYCSASLISLDQKDFDHLFASTLADTTNFDRDVFGGSEELRAALGELPYSSISVGFQRKMSGMDDLFRCIGFIPNRRYVVVHVCQV